MVKQKVLIIAGPTASGKKQAALRISERFNGEIVNADSRKVYRYLDIGTAKPSLVERASIPHHLIDICDPDEPFSAGEWVKRATDAVASILARGRLPVISGGTGFYITSFVEGLSPGIAADPEVRRSLKDELAAEGVRPLYRRLMEIDPARASELEENDSFRIMRALEVFLTAGKTLSSLRSGERVNGGDYDYLFIGISMERDMLYERINDRVDRMVSEGLLEELKAVLSRGYPRDIPALDTVGYKEWFPYLDGGRTFEQCLDEVKRNTRRYAKRQMTWFRSRREIIWFDLTVSGAWDGLNETIGKWLSSHRES